MWDAVFDKFQKTKRIFSLSNLTFHVLNCTNVSTDCVIPNHNTAILTKAAGQAESCRDLLYYGASPRFFFFMPRLLVLPSLDHTTLVRATSSCIFKSCVCVWVGPYLLFLFSWMLFFLLHIIMTHQFILMCLHICLLSLVSVLAHWYCQLTFIDHTSAWR